MYNPTAEEMAAKIAFLEEQIKSQADMLERQHSTNNVHGNRINELIREKNALEVEVADQRKVAKLHESTASDLQVELNKARAEIRLVRENWEHDLREISDAFRREAIDRDWCEEANEFIHDLNQTIHGALTPPRTTYEVAVQVLVSVDVTVDAYDEDDARQMAANEWRNLWTDRDYDARELVENGTTQAVDTFDVQEV